MTRMDEQQERPDEPDSAQREESLWLKQAARIEQQADWPLEERVERLRGWAYVMARESERLRRRAAILDQYAAFLARRAEQLADTGGNHPSAPPGADPAD